MPVPPASGYSGAGCPGQVGNPSPGPHGFANTGLVQPEAVVTLLHITSPIPVGKTPSVPDKLPRFLKTLPLPKRG